MACSNVIILGLPIKYIVKITSHFFKVDISKLKSHMRLPMCVQESLMMEKT